MKVGLVLEGGAMRGMYTAGILDTFLDENIEFDSIVGVSAGALFGVNYLSKQKGRVIRYNKRFNHSKGYLGLLPLLKEGNIVNTEFAYEQVPRKLDPFDDETYQQSTVPFYAVITNFDTGLPEYVQIKSVFEQMDTLRASGSMPFVSRPVTIGNHRYLDGAITDSIPFEFLKNEGCDKLVVVLTRDINYKKGPMSPAMAKLFYHKQPAFMERALSRHLVYNRSVEELKKWEQEGKAFVLRPSAPIEISRMEKDPDKLQAVYDLGIKDCQNQLEALKKYLTNNTF